MPIIVQCPACQKKMKIKEPTPGKKIRCPSCQEPFVPKAIGGGGGGQKPAKKKRKPVDDYDDYGDDYGDDYEDDYEERPQRKAAAAGKGAKGAKAGKGGSKSRKGAAKRKQPAATRSKTPLIVGLVVVLLAAAGGVTWALMGDGDGGTEVADGGGGADSGDAGGGETDAGGGEHGESGAPAGGGGSGGSEHGGGERRNVANSGSGGGGSSSVTPYQQTGPVDLSYVPASAEAVVKIDVGRLVEGPLGQLLQMEQVSGQLAMAEQMLGLTVKDIESVTVGVGGISNAITVGRPPQPTDLPIVVVLRTSVALDEAKLTGMIPGGQPVSENGLSYTRVSPPGGDGPPLAVWFVDSNTVVAAIETVMQTVAPIPPQPTLIDEGMFDGTSPLQVVFSPSNPDAIFRGPQMQLPPQLEMPPAAKGMVETFLASANGAGLGIDLTNDLGFSLSVRCKDSGSAGKLMEDLKAANEESKQAQAGGFNPFAGLQQQLEESQKMEVDGSLVRMSSSAEGGGQQLAAFMPMIVGMAQMQMQQGMAGGPGMGGGSMMGGPGAPMSTSDKMKNVALALLNFHDVYGRLPNAKPQGLNHAGLSWRVHVLPFLGYQELYDQFDVDQPWDRSTEHRAGRPDAGCLRV